MSERTRESALLGAATATGAAGLAWLAAWKPVAALVGVAGGALVLLVATRARLVLLVTVAALPWEDALPYPTAKLTLVKVLAVLLLVAWGVRALGRHEAVRLPRGLRAAPALGLAVGLALLLSPDPTAGLLESLRYAMLLIFAFLVVQLVRSREDVQAVLRVLVVSTALAAAWGLWAFLVGDEPRVRGALGDPNDFGLVLCGALPFAIHLVRTEPHRRVAWGLCVLLQVTALLGTLSRGAVVGLAAVAVWLVVTRRVSPGRVMLGVAGAVALVALAFAIAGPVVRDRLESKDRVAEANVASRKAMWRGAVLMAADRPFTGVGPGRFGEESHRYVFDDALAIHAPVVHNLYLHVLAETGIVGLGALLALLAAAWAGLARARRRARAGPDRELLRLVTATQSALLATLVAAAFLSAQFSSSLWLLVALAAVLGDGVPRLRRP